MTDLQIDISGRRGSFDYCWQLQLEASGVTGLLGPSGSGKTTLLRLLAGLDTRGSGSVVFGDSVWFDSLRGRCLPAHRREVGYVFQDARLLPHLNVLGNLRYAASRAKVAASEFDEVVGELALEPLIGREVSNLSGGERQRVAMGRALLTRPRLLLLDEPLSANDLERRGALLPYLRRIAREHAIPTLYVSHSLDEMAALTETLVVCRAGRVVATGPTGDLVQRTDLQQLGHGLQTGALLAGCVVAIDARLGVAELDVGAGRFLVPGQSLHLGDTVRLQIHARDVAIALSEPEGLSIRNVLPAKVVEIIDPGVGAYADVKLDVGPCALWSRITRVSLEALSLKPDTACYALVKAASVEQNAAFDNG